MTIAIVIGYFVFCILFAIFLEYRSRKKHENATSEDYTTGKKSMGLWLVFSLMAGNVVSGSYVVGNTSGVFQYDIAYLWTFYAYIIGWGITYFYIDAYRAAAYKYGANSLGEVFKAYYGPRVSLCVSAVVFVALAGAVSAQMVIVAGLLRTLLGISEGLSIAITIAALTLLALMGGMKGLASVNLIHIIMLVISVGLMLAVCLGAIGGDYGQVISGLESTGTFKLFGGSRSTSYIIGTILLQPFVCVVSALSVVGTFGAKTVRVAKRAQLMLPVFAVLFFASVIIVATIGKYLWPDMEPSTAWYTISQQFGPVMFGLAGCGVLAASMSTAPSQIMLMSSTAMEAYVPRAKRELSESRKMMLTKVLIVIFGVAFQMLGILSDDIVSIMSNAYTVWAVCGIVFTISLIWKRPNEKAMFYSLLFGIIVCIVWIAWGYIFGGTPFGIDITWAAGGISVVTEIVLTLATSPRGASECYMRYKEAKNEMYAEIKAGNEV